MSCRRFSILIMLLIQHSSSLWALVNPSDSLFYQTNFGQELNTYYWLYQIYYERPFFNKGLLHINENYSSSLIRLSRDDHKWKDDQQLNLELFMLLTKMWKLKFAAAANQFSDRLSGIVSDIKTNWSTIGFQFQPRSGIELNSSIGYKYDDRQVRLDHGMTYDFEGITDSVVFKDYENQFYFLNKRDKYSERDNNDFQLKYRVSKHFQEEAFDSLYIFWTKKRRDNYDLMDVNQINIESYEEENRGLQHYLIYGIPTGIQFRFRTLLNSRQTSVGKYIEDAANESRSKQEFHSENEIGFLMKRSYMALNFSLGYETDDQKNEVPDSSRTKKFSKYYYYISPDFESSRLTLSGRSAFYLFRSDTLQLSGSISRYRYDTPANNVDDRDELRWNFSIAEFHHFSPYLKLISNGSITLNHLVYIFGERSANNNWMRIFRLFPQLIYQPNNKFSLTHDLEVLANYVDYDFEFGSSSVDLKSFVFRKFSLTQEINAQITKHTSIFLSHRIELEENGKLDWQRWIEFLQMSRETYWLRTNLNFHAKEHIIFAPGFLYSRRVEKNQSYSSLSSDLGGKTGTMVSYGPTFRLLFTLKKQLNLSFEGMRRAVTMQSNQRSYFNNVNLVLTWLN